MVYYLVVGARGVVVDVCTTLKEAERSCRQYRRVVGPYFRVDAAEAVGDKWC